MQQLRLTFIKGDDQTILMSKEYGRQFMFIQALRASRADRCDETGALMLMGHPDGLIRVTPSVFNGAGVQA